MVSVIQRDAAGKQRTAGGVLQRGMEIERLVDATIEAEYEDNGLYHKKVTARVKTEKGEELTIHGDVTSFIPLRNRRGESVTHIGEGMTRMAARRPRRLRALRAAAAGEVAKHRMRMESARDAAAWLLPALASAVAAGALVRIGVGREAAELAALARWLCVAAAVLGSLPAWLGRGR